MSDFKNIALIVAAGKGLRMASKVPKQYLTIGDIPVLARTIQTFDRINEIHDIVVVIPQGDSGYCDDVILKPFKTTKKVYVVEGGKHRQDSVFNGLKQARKIAAVPDKCLVLIHDGVRPFVETAVILSCITKAQEHGACIPAVKISDTIKKVETKTRIDDTVDRDMLYGAQTPQVFHLDEIWAAFEYAEETNFTGTDDASLMEHFGKQVVITQGSKFNIKITTKEDLVFAQFIAKTL